MRSPIPQRANERKRAITTIHVLKAQAGMDDDDYRTMLHAQTGKASCKDMDIVELRRVLDHFARLGVKSQSRQRLDRVGQSRQRLLAKLTAQLSAAGRDRKYLDVLVKRIAKVDALEFCDEQALSKLIAALAIDANRHGRAYP